MTHWWNGGWACWVGKVKCRTSSWVGTYHIFIALTSQGEPGADGASGKEVPLVLTCPSPACSRPGLAPSSFTQSGSQSADCLGTDI